MQVTQDCTQNLCQRVVGVKGAQEIGEGSLGMVGLGWGKVKSGKEP